MAAIETPWANAPDWDTAGIAFAELLLSWRQWTHRKVEVIEFQDETLARRAVSVDFTIPSVPAVMASSSGLLQIVPIARLRKRTLTNFDLTDEGGRSLPMLARDQHKELATSTLVALARTLMAERVEEVRANCRQVATLPPKQALPAFKKLLAYEQLANSPEFVALGRALAECFVLAVPMGAEVGVRRIVKFSYDELVGDPNLTLREDLERGSAWRSKPLWFPVYTMSDAPSYHLEVLAPTGLQITRRELIVSDLPDKAERRRGPYRRAHFYHRPSAFCRGVAVIHLRPQTSTIVRAAASLSSLTCLLLSLFWLAMLLGGFPERPGSAPSLLLFLPGALSVLLVRSGEHAMTTDILWFLRVLTLSAGGLAVLGGIAFAALSGRAALTIVLGALALAALRILTRVQRSLNSAARNRTRRTPRSKRFLQKETMQHAR